MNSGMILASPVRRDSQNQTNALLAFSAALVSGGLVTAAALWLASGLTSPIPVAARIAALAAISGVVVMHQFIRIPGLKLPDPARQIPREVFRASPHRAALRFGFELGLGWRTYITSPSAYLLAAGILLIGQAPTSLLAGVGFGVGRTAMPWLRRGSDDGDTWDRRSVRHLRQAGRFLVAVVAVALIMIGLVTY